MFTAPHRHRGRSYRRLPRIFLALAHFACQNATGDQKGLPLALAAAGCCCLEDAALALVSLLPRPNDSASVNNVRSASFAMLEGAIEVATEYADDAKCVARSAAEDDEGGGGSSVTDSACSNACL